MSEFRKAFQKAVEPYTRGMAPRAFLEFGDEKDILRIPETHPSGFEVQLECMDYGVYPSAQGWHGGCWDVTVWEPNKLGSSLVEFVDSVLNDAVLEVHLTNGNPYKWVLKHTFEGERVFDETGLLFFNWFGRRSIERYSNGTAI